MFWINVLRLSADGYPGINSLREVNDIKAVTDPAIKITRNTKVSIVRIPLPLNEKSTSCVVSLNMEIRNLLDNLFLFSLFIVAILY